MVLFLQACRHIPYAAKLISFTMINQIIKFIVYYENKGDTIASYHRRILGNVKTSIQVQYFSDYGTFSC